MAEKIVKATNTTINKLIKDGIKKHGEDANLNYIDVSMVTDMSGLFSYFSKAEELVTSFNGDISEWDVSNVVEMSSMFAGSKFNGDISKWNVSNVKSMFAMFNRSKFNGDISKWDVSKVECMKEMFECSKFNGNISEWNVSNVASFEKFSENGVLEKKNMPKFVTDIVIPNSVTAIKPGAYKNCTGITSVVVPKSVTEIGWGAFDGCKAMTSISILGPVKSLTAVFQRCTSLDTVTLGVGIKEIYDKAFDDCPLKTIKVPIKEVDYYKQLLPEKLHALISALSD